MQETAAFQARILFAQLGRHLGQGLGGGYAHRQRDGGESAAGAGELLGIGVKIHVHALEVQEGFVNRIHFHAGREVAQHFLHPAGHIPIQREIGGENGYLVLADQRFDLEIGVPHPDAQGLGFVGAGNGTAVVVGEDDDRSAVQFRTEYPFAGCEKVVAVGQGVHGSQAFLITQVTTPQTRNSSSGFTGMGLYRPLSWLQGTSTTPSGPI